MEKSLMKRLLDAGYPLEEMSHHYSDLYVYVTPLTERVVKEWCKDMGYRQEHLCPIFISNTDGRKMYDCAFSYEPGLGKVSE